MMFCQASKSQGVTPCSKRASFGLVVVDALGKPLSLLVKKVMSQATPHLVPTSERCV